MHPRAAPFSPGNTQGAYTQIGWDTKRIQWFQVPHVHCVLPTREQWLKEIDQGEAEIWMKPAGFERQQGQVGLALKTVSTALSKYPEFAKLYIIQGQIHQAAEYHCAACATYSAGLKAPARGGGEKSIRARALIENARLVNPKSDVLWAEAVGIKERSGASAHWQAKGLLVRALQEYPSSDVLWSLEIWAEARPQRKARSVDALKKCADALVICTVARLFWAERKVIKARQWFERAIGANPDLGDAWGRGLRPQVRAAAWERGTGGGCRGLVARCAVEEPRHGATWQAIGKDDANRGKSTRELLELVAAALQRAFLGSCMLVVAERRNLGKDDEAGSYICLSDPPPLL
ncbi:hypothetical protein H4582DRAFT_2130095 [Lactarius indigo]|nr:hypothetical protein H4582DRAFT_2130095 [Lactarius indigo]